MAPPNTCTQNHVSKHTLRAARKPLLTRFSLQRSPHTISLQLCLNSHLLTSPTTLSGTRTHQALASIHDTLHSRQQWHPFKRQQGRPIAHQRRTSPGLCRKHRYHVRHRTPRLPRILRQQGHCGGSTSTCQPTAPLQLHCGPSRCVRRQDSLELRIRRTRLASNPRHCLGPQRGRDNLAPPCRSEAHPRAIQAKAPSPFHR